MTRQLLLFVAVALASIMTSQGCPRECRCIPGRVYCQEKNLTTLPLWIPSDTRVLVLYGNKISNSPSLERGLAKLVTLERLELHDNLLTSFPKNLPNTLTYISLSNNNLKYVGKDALRGLDRLQALHVEDNNLSDEGISQTSFELASDLEHLDLSNNRLTSLPRRIPGNLKSLRLEHNMISNIPDDSFPEDSDLVTLDLSFNQLKVGSIHGMLRLRKLRTLDVSHNLLENIPPHLPTNITDLLLSNNRIQFIFAQSSLLGDSPHGSLRGFPDLLTLDLSSNLLRSVERNSFSNIPRTSSVSIHDNPWRCDCNLIYLKSWFTMATVANGNNVRCASPPAFSDVTLYNIDVEALQCTHSAYKFETRDVTTNDVTIVYDASTASEPPYVTFSVMFGEMSCQSCDVTSKSGLSTASMWMVDYTILPLPPGVATHIGRLAPETRYAICIVTSYQHPDKIGIEQCDDVTTLSVVTTTSDSQVVTSSLPLWVYVMGGVLALLVVAGVVLVVVWRIQVKKSRSTSYTHAQSIPQHCLPSFMHDNANKEFDVTLMVRHQPNDVIQASDSCYSDSHDETTSTVHTGTGTMTSRTSHHIYEHLTSPAEQFLSPDVTNVPLSSSGMMV